MNPRKNSTWLTELLKNEARGDGRKHLCLGEDAKNNSISISKSPEQGGNWSVIRRPMPRVQSRSLAHTNLGKYVMGLKKKTLKLFFKIIKISKLFFRIFRKKFHRKQSTTPWRKIAQDLLQTRWALGKGGTYPCSRPSSQRSRRRSRRP